MRMWHVINTHSNTGLPAGGPPPGPACAPRRRRRGAAGRRARPAGIASLESKSRVLGARPRRAPPAGAGLAASSRWSARTHSSYGPVSAGAPPAVHWRPRESPPASGRAQLWQATFNNRTAPLAYELQAHSKSRKRRAGRAHALRYGTRRGTSLQLRRRAARARAAGHLHTLVIRRREAPAPQNCRACANASPAARRAPGRRAAGRRPRRLRRRASLRRRPSLKQAN